MYFYKPAWLTHPGELKDFEVYSCDVSPDGSRLATAAGDGYVRIWSTKAILHSADPTYSKPKQLAAVSHHSGTIHAVRFSSNGKYLASGADDKIVCVYNLDPNAPAHSTFGSNEPQAVENWRVTRRLVGHDNDVQDLGWSADSSILVSVGLDSKVVVWSGSSFEKLKTLSNHQSHVKGITFDPANKYFATASDDRTVKIYRFNSPPPNATQSDQVNNFVLEHTITAPFQTSPLTTYFRRCSWSPDGAHIAAANATNGPVNSVAILERGTWDASTNPISLIGHEGPVEVAAFSPRLFYKDPPKVEHDGSVHQPTVTVVACAGQDKTLSVWNTSFARPFLVSQDMASKSISDLAWHPNGEVLFASSLDGSVIALQFQPGELGWPAPLARNEESLQKFGAGRRAGIIEGTDALLLEESSKNGELKGVQGRMGALMGDEDGGAVQPPITNGTNGVLSSTNGPSTAVQAPAPVEPSADPRVEKLKQRVTVTKDGKKRIAPMLMSSSSGIGQSSLPQSQLISASTASGGRGDNPHTVIDLSKPYDMFARGGLASMVFGNKRKFAEIEGDEDRQVERKLAASMQPGGAAIVLNGENGLVPPPAAASRIHGLTGPPKALRPAIVSAALSASQVRLAVPKVRSIILRTTDGSDPTQGKVDANTGKAEVSETVMLEARNASGPSRTGRLQDHDPTRITCTSKGQPLWQDFLPMAVILVTGNDNFFAAACEDGSVYAWSPAGRRIINAMILDAQPVIMDCRGWWLTCISAVGMCHIWNLKTSTAPHPPISVAPILDIAAHTQGPHLTKGPGIVFARLNSEGRIVVAMSTGHGYVYNPRMYIWQQISEPWWSVGSQYWNTTDSSVSNIRSSQNKSAPVEKNDMVSVENIAAGIIPALERNTTNQFLLQGRAFYLQRLIKALISAEGYETFESSVSVAHLENRVAAAKTLGAREEFKIYLSMYVKRLGAEGLKGKIEELLRSLTGDLIAGDDDDDDSEEKQEEVICGWKREELVKEVVLILGKHRDLQRITVPYARLLGIVTEHARDHAASDAEMAL